MCSIPKIDTSAQTKVIQEQLNKSNALLSNAEAAKTTGEKVSNKRRISSLRVPIKNQTSGTVGVNQADTTTGLNIPV